MYELLKRALLAASLGAFSSSAALADAGRTMPRSVPAIYLQECASCHVAYPPGMLPAVSWQRIVSRLDKHFGTDASLDAPTANGIGAWLQAQAGTGRRSAEPPSQDRITRTAWFERKHRKLAADVWRLPSVGSAGRCEACHAGADRGLFDDHDLQAPAGVTLRQRRAWFD